MVFLLHTQRHTATKIPFMYSCSGNYAALPPQSQFPHSCVFELFVYSQDWSTYFLQQNRQIDCGNLYIAQTYECGNWDVWPRNFFLGIFFSNFRYWFFAMQPLKRTTKYITTQRFFVLLFRNHNNMMPSRSSFQHEKKIP